MSEGRGPSGDFEVVRDPLWNNIRLDGAALELLDSAPFQRLRYIRQLGHAFLVYPGATHTRFEHALGAYHLAGRALGLLGERGELAALPPHDALLVRLAALLHDIGHYPFSHALEEAGLLSHEDLAAEHLAHPEVTAALARTGLPDAAARIAELITGRSTSPLQGLISGSLDLDKIDYLTRDARMCGVPYGTVDVDRLLHSLTLVPLPEGEGRRAIAVREKGASALESLTFAKYQMYRNVYWHHAVRAATTMFKRAVRAAIACGQIAVAWIAHTTAAALVERPRQMDDAPLARQPGPDEIDYALERVGGFMPCVFAHNALHVSSAGTRKGSTGPLKDDDSGPQLSRCRLPRPRSPVRAAVDSCQCCEY